jgi:hypothetical protein
MMECLICKSRNIEIYIENINFSMLSDGEIVKHPLKKYLCKNCGLIFNIK